MNLDSAAVSARPRWTSRITGEAEVDATLLTAHPLNWRAHPATQAEALHEVLDRVGWVQRVIVNERTGHVLDGHLRVAEAARHGTSVPVVYVDLTEEEERLVLATLDPLAALAETDGPAWLALQELTENLPAAIHDAAAFSQFEAGAADLTLDKTPPPPTVHLIIPVADLSAVEAALASTGESHRGKALLKIVNHWHQTLGEKAK